MTSQQDERGQQNVTQSRLLVVPLRVVTPPCECPHHIFIHHHLHAQFFKFRLFFWFVGPNLTTFSNKVLSARVIELSLSFDFRVSNRSVSFNIKSKRHRVRQVLILFIFCGVCGDFVLDKLITKLKKIRRSRQYPHSEEDSPVI